MTESDSAKHNLVKSSFQELKKNFIWILTFSLLINFSTFILSYFRVSDFFDLYFAHYYSLFSYQFFSPYYFIKTILVIINLGLRSMLIFSLINLFSFIVSSKTAKKNGFIEQKLNWKSKITQLIISTIVMSILFILILIAGSILLHAFRIFRPEGGGRVGTRDFENYFLCVILIIFTIEITISILLYSCLFQIPEQINISKLSFVENLRKGFFYAKANRKSLFLSFMSILIIGIISFVSINFISLIINAVLVKETIPTIMTQIPSQKYNSIFIASNISTIIFFIMFLSLKCALLKKRIKDKNF